MADFPRIKWLNVDGQQVPFTEPQHFTGNGDETVRTGHDNPLPVANYTQNESGLWLPTSKENPMPTQVTGSKVEVIKSFNYETTGTNNAYFGSGVGTGPLEQNDLDVSPYKQVSLAVKNDTDKEFNCRALLARLENRERDMERYLLLDIDLPSGSSTVINGKEHDSTDGTRFLDDIYLPFMTFRILNNDGLGEGIIKVSFVGVRR